MNSLAHIPLPSAADVAPLRLQRPADLPLVSQLGPAREAIPKLRAAWSELAQAASEPNCYAEPWFVEAALDSLDPEGEIDLFAAWRGDRLVGLIALAAERGYARLPVRFVQNWLHPQAFLGTPLIARGEEKAFWTALLARLDTTRGARNLIHLRGLVEDGPVHRGLVAAAAAAGRRTPVVYRESRALLASDLGPEDYFRRNVRPKKRKEIRRLQSRLAELGTVTARRLDADDDLEAWCDAFLALEKSGWKGDAGSALGCDPRSDAFFRQATRGARDAGRLDFLRLDLDGRPIAMLVNFIAAPGSFSFKTAFDEGFARFSPGVLIQIENLKRLTDSEVNWMDSCAVENHSMIDRLWSERRSIVRVTVPLRGPRDRLVFAFCRALEIGSQARRRLFSRSAG